MIENLDIFPEDNFAEGFTDAQGLVTNPLNTGTQSRPHCPPQSLEGEEIGARREPCPTNFFESPENPQASESGTVQDDATSQGSTGARGAGVPVSSDTFIEFPRGTTDLEIEEAQERANLCKRFIELTGPMHGLSGNQAAAELGKAASWFSTMVPLFRSGGTAALVPKRRECGAKPTFGVPEWFIPAAKFFWMLSNRNRDRGSAPEAIRRTISLPACPAPVVTKLLQSLGMKELPSCPEDLREMVIARDRAGQSLLPERLMKQITASSAAVNFHRRPRNFGLDYLCSPGSMRLWTHPESGERFRLRAGDFIEGDDSTPGIAVCVPWERGGTPSAHRYGVMIGRFQWIAFMDAAWDYVTGFTYVIRPRSSYRKEDVGTGMKGTCKAHGIPRLGWRFERGTWESNMVKQIVKGLGNHLWTVHSPHNKLIEILFNRVWTKLAVQFPHADLGRYRGENEANCRIYDACKAGTKDPRHYFPMLADVLASFVEVIAEHNRTRVESRNYGAWIPEERWAEELQAMPLRPLDGATEWLFHPWTMERTVKGMLVGGKVPIFEEFSVPFDFSAPWLTDYHGARVRLHFDPMEPRCVATAVLVERFGQCKAGTVLGSVTQVNEMAGYARLVLGWGDDPTNAGKLMRQRVASYVRRETRAIVPGGRVTYSQSEIRDVAETARLETGAPISREEAQKPQRDSKPVRDVEQLAEREAQANRVVEENVLDFL